MIYKKFKTLGMEPLSAVGYGCWAIGGTWNNTEDEKSVETIRTAIENGINFFDVAPIYGRGHSETVLGMGIKGYDRKKLFIATKCGLVWDEEGNVTKDLTRKSIYREVEASMKRLGTDYLDLLQIHWPFPGMPLEEAMETMMELKRKGIVRYIGVSNFSKEMTERCMELAEISTHQGLYNMIEHNPKFYHHKVLEYKTKDEILPLCRENGMAFLPYSPIMQGLLTGAFKRENNFDENDDRAKNPKLNGELYIKYYNAVEELKEIAKRLGKPLSQLAINWLIAQPEVGPVICGAQTPDQILENIGSCTWTLDASTLEEIDKILKRYEID
ncbi:MAG: aldo/keto reductase [Cetobacterium sp.]